MLPITLPSNWRGSVVIKYDKSQQLWGLRVKCKCKLSKKEKEKGTEKWLGCRLRWHCILLGPYSAK